MKLTNPDKRTLWNLESQIEDLRKTLCLRGYCGDGNLVYCLNRALDESLERGRKSESRWYDALMEASDALPRHMEGTVEERIKVLVDLLKTIANYDGTPRTTVRVIRETLGLDDD